MQDERENKVQKAIDRIQAAIDTKGPEPLLRLEKSMNDVTFAELCRYQEVKSAAQVGGLLTLDEALQVYRILGGEAPSVEKWKARTMAEKITVTQLAWEIECAMGHTSASSRTAVKRRRRK